MDRTTLPRGRLLQVLGVAFGLAVIIGNTMGGGILQAPGKIAGQLHSVPLVLAVWIAGGLYALLGANSLAELGAMLPRSGGQYVFVRRALGPYPAFVVGWSDWISSAGSTAWIALVIAGYGAQLVPSFAGEPHGVVVTSVLALATHTNAVAAIIVIGFTLLHWGGIRIGDAAQQVSSLLKTLVFIALIVACFAVSGAHSIEPAPVAHSLAAGGLLAALIVSLQAAIYTYDGWTGVLYFGEEVKDPGRNIPRSMIGGVLLVTAIYLLVNLAFLHVLGVEKMAGDPFVVSAASRVVFGDQGERIVPAVMILAMLSSVNACLLLASRVPVAMSRDGLMPVVLSNVNRGGTPAPALFASATVALVFLFSGTIDTVLALLAFFFVASYTLSFTSVFALRRSEPNTPRPYRAWGHPWTTGLALAISVAFLIGSIASDWDNSWKSLLALTASFPVYWIVRRFKRA